MPTSPLSLTLEPTPSRKDIHFLVEQLVSFNEAHHPGAVGDLLGVMLRDRKKQPVGGALGSTHWGWLHISHLWVPEALRGQGWGRKVLAELEAGAVGRGCHAVYVDTFSFQARPFYEACGYTLFGELPDFPVGGKLYFLWKRLGPAAAGG